MDFAKFSSTHLSNLNSSTTIPVSICLIIAVGFWRHYDTDIHQNPFQQEVWIEWLSWVTIFAVNRLLNISATTYSNIPQVQSFWSSKPAIWVTGAAIVASQLLSSQENLAWFLPLTTIVVTVAAQYMPLLREPEISDKELDDVTPRYSDVKDIERTRVLPFTIILNVICCVLFAGTKGASHSMFAYLCGILLVAARSTTIVSIAKLQQHENRDAADSPLLEPMRYLAALSAPVLSLLTIVLVIVRPDLSMSSTAVVGHALAQSLWWIAAVNLLRAGFVNTTANLDSISLSSELAILATSLPSSISTVLALGLAGLQSLLVVKPGSGATRAILIAGGLFALGIWLHADPRLSSAAASRSSTYIGHPIESLITAQRAHFEALKAKQSKTVSQAVAEYERRWHRRPPLGFDKWYLLAQEHNFPLPDEFDTFMQSLEPFHGIYPTVIQQRMDKVLESDAGRMHILEMENGNMTRMIGDVGERLTNSTFMKIVPYNMTMILNIWDESMVCADFDEVTEAIAQARLPAWPEKLKQSHVNPLIETGKQNGWAATLHACSQNSASRQVRCEERQLTTKLPFVSNISFAIDVCENCEIKKEQGLLLSPGNMKVAHELAPIWSASKPSHFHDILYPSAYYIGVRGDYRSKLDLPWEDKDSKFYWTGTSTGGWGTVDSWKHMQRQRLVLKTMKTNTDSVQLLEETAPGSNKWTPRYSTMAEVSDLFATRITNVDQCTEEACAIQKEAFGLNKEGASGDSQDAAYSHKFVLDIDGNGFSGRYYRLLHSRSVVVKNTILREWHDDRLIPWVHYVPLSSSYAELPEMARFMGTTERGLQLSERIAKESTEWHNVALRDVDLQLAWTRMMLEYGRVMQPDIHM